MGVNELILSYCDDEKHNWVTYHIFH